MPRPPARLLTLLTVVGVVLLVALAAQRGLPGRVEDGADLVTPAPAPTPTPTAGSPWTTIAAAPIDREQHSLTWTGREAIVFGGVATDGERVRLTADGARYRPDTDTWARVPPAPIAARGEHTAVFTGRELLVFGGRGAQGPLADGAAYDVERDAWRRLPPSPLGPRVAHTATWVDDEMVVWGGAAAPGRPLGAAYDPEADRWRVLPEAPVTTRVGHTAVWTGVELVIWGGVDPQGEYRADGAAYRPALDLWRAVRRAPVAGRSTHLAVWATPRPVRMFVWGGQGADGALGDGAAYDPNARRWEPLPEAPLAARIGPAGAWTGRRLVVGPGVAQQLHVDAAVYDPARGRWRRLPPGPLFAPARYPPAWTDRGLLLWAGVHQASGALLAVP